MRFHEIHERLCRALADNGEAKRAAGKFAEMGSDNGRVEFARGLLRRFDLHPRVEVPGKSDEASCALRNEGNGLFRNRKNADALETYTKSAGFAEKADCLALAYANRSAVLFDSGKFDECLTDVENALALNPTPKLVEKLERRRSNALKSRPSPLVEPRGEVPAPATPNELIRCASGCVTIRASESMGRHVVATSDMEIGTVVAVERPFAAVLASTAKSWLHCHHCLRACFNLLPCAGCTGAFFCTDVCRQAAWGVYHRYECPLQGLLEALGVDKLARLALRVSICARSEYGKIPRFGGGDMYESERYEEIHQLVTNTDKRSVADMFQRAVKAAVLYELTHEHSSFLNNEEEHTRNTFKALLLHHLQTGPSNFHEICYTLGSNTKPFELEEVGAGAYAFLSLLNHSCNPNVVRHCYGTTVVLRALRPIKRGEQLYDNYGYHYAVMPKPQRRENLREQYFFDCNCEACAEDWPLYGELPVLGVDLGVSESEFGELARDGVRDLEGLVRRVVEVLKEMDERGASREIAGAQEVLKQCFGLMGNKLRMIE